ncbi:uncharacterized protein LOC135809222 [Sycon ciliatum]|uniref:uncharacterized protein LOC135809222 n=1 Tax=Sycon ciliatum TaxID=27933 RepID=UPI0031F6407C
METPRKKPRQSLDVVRSSDLLQFFSYCPDQEFADVLKFFSHVLPSLELLLEENIEQWGQYKCSLVVQVVMQKLNPATGQVVSSTFFFRSSTTLVLNTTELRDLLSTMVAQINARRDDFVRHGSGWVVERISCLHIEMSRYCVLGGSSYIPLPPELKSKKAIVNVQNTDNKCLLWSILAAKFSVDKSHPCRQSSYAEHVDTVDVSGIEFPAKLEYIAVIERLNDGLYINVFGYEEKVIYPLRISQQPQTAINVLFIQDERNNVDVQHWVWKKSFSRLVATGARRAHFVCFSCLSTHVTEKTLNNHMMYCSEHPEATVEMPKAGDRVMFKNVNKQLQAPFKVSNAGQMIISESQQREFETVVSCWICGEALGSDRVRDHCHITGAYRGAAHNHCNLNMRIEPFKIKIPVFFHNLKGYDSHHIISAIGRTSIDENYTKRLGAINVIPINSEKYVTFGWRQFQFIDSLVFLNTSLDRLVSATPPNAFTLLSVRFPDEDERKLLTRKGVYPYEYMGSYDQFEETRLPPKDAFHSTLTDTDISDEGYAYAQTVWTAFDCEDLGDYHDLYLETDVLLLADVFENFRRTAHTSYGLDPANYLTLPGFAWDSLLKMTKVSLHLISDMAKEVV